MTTFADLIENTRSHLMTSQQDRLNVLHTSIDTDDTTVLLTYANKGISEGSMIAIDLEQMYVVEVNNSSSPVALTVIRNHGGSTAAAHTAGTKIYCNPQFSDFRISQMVNVGLDNLSSEGLFAIDTVTFTASAQQQGYDLAGATNLIDLWRVRWDDIGIPNNWPVLRPDEYYLDNDPDSTDFPSGHALILMLPVNPGRAVRVTYRRGFNHLTSLTDDVATVSKLHSEAHDLPSLYAAICLLAGREVKRTFLSNQPEPRRQDEVPPGSANQAMQPIIKLYYQRVDTEISRLKRKYPRAI